MGADKIDPEINVHDTAASECGIIIMITQAILMSTRVRSLVHMQ